MINASSQQQFQHAQQLQHQGHLAQAETLYLALLNDVNNTAMHEPIIGALCHLYLRWQKFDKAAIYLQQLHLRQAGNVSVLNQLIKLYSKQHNWQQVCENYQRFLATPLEKITHLANHYFNYGYYLKQAGHYTDAVEQFQLAIDNNINQSEDVYLNMAVVFSENLRQESKAKQALTKAITINPSYVPALYNLATLLEEEGDKNAAKAYFEQTLALEPNHINALARCADLEHCNTVEHPLIAKLQKALLLTSLTTNDKINVHYALGKAFNDCHAYASAYDHYQQANQLNSSIIEPYQPLKTEQNVNTNIAVFDQKWFAAIEPISTEPCVFICGMFRSGSTLTEQILAAHPNITAGGELDFIPKLVTEQLIGYPESLRTASQSELTLYAQQYLTLLDSTFRLSSEFETLGLAPNGENNCANIRITDKRPDNFLNIALIKTLFPNAKIIHTLRNKQDNCLSLFFLRLAESLNYACDIENIEHFYEQHVKLMDHWKSVFANDIFTLNYESLVATPKTTINDMLEFLGLPWDDQCLEFSSLKNRVKTASVWKVRQPLFNSSVNRFAHYQDLINR